MKAEPSVVPGSYRRVALAGGFAEAIRTGGAQLCRHRGPKPRLPYARRRHCRWSAGDLRFRRELKDLLRTDVVMPGSINRRRLAIEARSRRPLRKILCTSGYAESALIQDRRRDADALLPAKPCRKPDLAKDDPRRSGGLMRSQIVINAEITRRPKFARYQSSHQRSIEPSI